MKHLVLLRHAKSSWQDASLDDFDRPLNKRGERNRHQLATALGRQPLDPSPQRVFTSPARRARLTAEAVHEALAPNAPLQTDARLYTFAARALVAFLRELEEDLERVALIGHNPALTDLVNWLDPARPLDNLPTCSLVHLTLNCARWRDLEANTGERRLLLLARELPEAGES